STIRKLRSTLLLDDNFYKTLQFSVVKADNSISLNIYGPSTPWIYQHVGKTLGDAEAYLQCPSTIRPNTIYDNPQWLYRPGATRDLTHQVEYVGREGALWSSSDILRMAEQRGILRKLFRLQ